MKYKAKTRFNYFKTINAGDIIELNDEEYSRLNHVVESINDTPAFVDELVKKPNKSYKKGRKK